MAAELWRHLRQVGYLDVLVVLPELHQLMVGSDGFAKLPDVRAHSDVVLPDLPVLKAAPECFPESTEGWLPVQKQARARKQSRKPTSGAAQQRAHKQRQTLLENRMD